MKRTLITIAVALLVGMLAGPVVLGGDSPEKVEGEVVQVMQNVRTENGGDFDAVMVRTRNGEHKRLLLGESGGCPDCVRAGDQVRMRLSAGGPVEGGYQVQSMQVRRTGEETRFRDANGDLLRSRTQSRDGSGGGGETADRTRSRARTHEPGSGNCTGSGSGSRGSGNRGGGRR